MEWSKSYLDLILIPLSLLSFFLYHAWLWRKVEAEPHLTDIGISSAAHRQWVISMMKENDKKNILAVQTLRNSIMGATLMASTTILLCTGLAAVLSSTYSVKHSVNGAVYGAHGPLSLALKYAVILAVFLAAFYAYSLSIWFFSQVNFLINVVGDCGSPPVVSPEYVSRMLEKAFMLWIAGNRIFYSGISLLLWIFGPTLVLLCSVFVLQVLYKMDINGEEDGVRVFAEGDERRAKSLV
ncbi:hypothetical protein AXF42_Ash007487 [Apostasia shenzhenica]|uniref:DUF599 domain-containing protein n=1 Tax=Apostasia shenzhenica TaxID=1088818 RepID=A0A2I0A5M5_9ASPA|nr:hypothetical protein AXF42_Ash007487 [Apostasia shenzhenica]